MTKYQFDHIHLYSPDPAKTALFYQKMFGARQVGSRQLPDGRTSIELDLNGTRLAVVKPPDQPAAAAAPGHGLDHFGLKTDSLEKAAAELKANGVEFTVEPRAAGPGLKISFLAAPDKVRIELMERQA
ncbi:MAG: VOC family protein [Chloroflexota bacterium]